MTALAKRLYSRPQHLAAADYLQAAATEATGAHAVTERMLKLRAAFEHVQSVDAVDLVRAAERRTLTLMVTMRCSKREAQTAIAEELRTADEVTP